MHTMRRVGTHYLNCSRLQLPAVTVSSTTTGRPAARRGGPPAVRVTRTGRARRSASRSAAVTCWPAPRERLGLRLADAGRPGHEVADRLELGVGVAGRTAPAAPRPTGRTAAPSRRKRARRRRMTSRCGGDRRGAGPAGAVALELEPVDQAADAGGREPGLLTSSHGHRPGPQQRSTAFSSVAQQPAPRPGGVAHPRGRAKLASGQVKPFDEVSPARLRPARASRLTCDQLIADASFGRTNSYRTGQGRVRTNATSIDHRRWRRRDGSRAGTAPGGLGTGHLRGLPALGGAGSGGVPDHGRQRARCAGRGRR